MKPPIKTWDVIIAGGGIIGLSLALELRKNGARALVMERGELGREASLAAAGMLAPHDPWAPAALNELCKASAKLYPEFVQELESLSGIKIDFRSEGTLTLEEAEMPPSAASSPAAHPCGGSTLSPEEVAILEPELALGGRRAVRLEENCVDTQHLMAAATAAAKQRGVDVMTSSPVNEILIENADNARVAGVTTAHGRYGAGIVVNCCGAWASQIQPVHSGANPAPTRPVKGQMLAVMPPKKDLLRHVVRAEEVYMVPRTDGPVIIGSTAEEAGFNKSVDTETIQKLHQAAIRLLPKLGNGHFLESWAGLRPGTPDDLPILGPTDVEGYFIATGHFRSGILLAPVTARIIARMIRGERPEFDLAAFSPARFRKVKGSTRGE